MKKPRKVVLIRQINAKGKKVLIIPDLHCPYHHSDSFNFLLAVKKKFTNKNSIIINLGDEIDNHAISFHKSESELFSAGHELEMACKFLQQLNKIFHKMFLLESNHGSLIFRRLKHEGIPIRVLKELNDIYGVTGWTWHHDIKLTTKHDLPTYLCHGKSSPYNKLAKDVGMNAIQGHFHGKFELTWFKSPTIERYNIFSGCLIDWNSLAFAYGKNNIPKPILGCVVIDKQGNPILVKMNLNSSGRWIGRV